MDVEFHRNERRSLLPSEMLVFHRNRAGPKIRIKFKSVHSNFQQTSPARPLKNDDTQFQLMGYIQQFIVFYIPLFRKHPLRLRKFT